jgi:transcriptional antiterminator/mannitol/fructose-specific phosphotransferase system IIA component (Ntr-type)
VGFMELNQHGVKILQLLFDSDAQYLTIKELAQVLETSERVVNHNLTKLDSFLSKKGCGYIERKRGKGIRILKTDQFVTVYNKFMKTENPYTYRFSNDERQKYITCYLLLNDKYTTIEALSRKLGISYSTTAAHLQNVEQDLEGDSITLIRKPRLGLSIKGLEEDIRNSYIRRLLYEVSSEKEILNYYYNVGSVGKLPMMVFEDFCPIAQSGLFISFLRNVEEELKRHFSDDNFAFLLVYLSLVIQRIHQGCYLPDKKQVYELFNESMFSIFLPLVQEFNNLFEITLPRQEINALFIHLLGAQSIMIDSKTVANAPENMELLSIVEQIVSEIESVYRIEFGKNRRKLVKSLLAHLMPAVNRIRYQQKIINPIYNELITKHRQLFMNTRSAIAPLETYLNNAVDNHEVSFIAIYFLAALNEATNREIQLPRVLIVCGSGYGTAQVVSIQVQNLFNAEIVAVISGRDAAKYKNRGSYDYLISTVDLPDFQEDQYIKVSPLFTDEDYVRLKEFLDVRYASGAQQLQQVALTKKLSAIAGKFGAENNLQQMQYEFLAVLMGAKDNFMQRGSPHLLSLREMMPGNLMRFNVECCNWREAVTQGTLILEENKIVEPRYKEAIIKNLIDFGPNMVMFPNVVISHARPVDGCLKPAFGFINLKRPIGFGSRYHDPAKAIITLSVVNTDSHLNALVQLFNMLSNSDDREKLLRAVTKDEVIRLIEQYPD